MRHDFNWEFISLKGGSMLMWEPENLIYWTAVRDLVSLSFETTKLSCLLGYKCYYFFCSDWECATVLVPAAILLCFRQPPISVARNNKCYFHSWPAGQQQWLLFRLNMGFQDVDLSCTSSSRTHAKGPWTSRAWSNCSTS